MPFGIYILVQVDGRIQNKERRPNNGKWHGKKKENKNMERDTSALGFPYKVQLSHEDFDEQKHKMRDNSYSI